MTEKKEKKNILIGALLVAIIAMAVGYAALAQQLTINGTAQVSSTWDVKFTSISEGTPSNSTGVTPTASNKTPAVISGFLTVGDISGSIMQIVNLIIGAMIYLPFLRIIDKAAKKEEDEANSEE